MDTINLIINEKHETVHLKVTEKKENVSVIVSEALAGISAYQTAVNNGFAGTADEWLLSLKGEEGRICVLTGAKQTGADPGILNELSLTDDYLYICVKSGDENTAVWKKAILYQT